MRLTDSVLVQELRAFLCAEAPLGSSPEWMQLQPIQTSMLENVSRLPKQLLGEHQALSGLEHEVGPDAAFPGVDLARPVIYPRCPSSHGLCCPQTLSPGPPSLWSAAPRQPWQAFSTRVGRLAWAICQGRSAAGQERSIPAPSEAAQSTKASGDLLRRFKEMKQSLTNELQEAPVLTDAEVALRVCPDEH